MQSTLDTACVVSYNSKDRRLVLGGGQGSSWNTRPKPSLLAGVLAALERVCVCVCAHIYDCVCPYVVWGRGVEAKVVFKIHLCRSPGSPSRDKQCSQKEIIIKNCRGLLITPFSHATAVVGRVVCCRYCPWCCYCPAGLYTLQA